MIVSEKFYCITTKEKPIMFLYSGNRVEELKYAQLFYTQEAARNEILKFDEPKEYEILEATLSVEI